MWNLLEKENVQSCDFGGIHSSAINYPEIKKKHNVLERTLDWQSGEPDSESDSLTKQGASAAQLPPGFQSYMRNGMLD